MHSLIARYLKLMQHCQVKVKCKDCYTINYKFVQLQIQGYAILIIIYWRFVVSWT